MGLFVDVEGGVREWLKEKLADMNLGGVWFAVPDGNPKLPLITLARIGGSPIRGEVPLDQARISFEIWASNKKVAVGVTERLVEALHQLRTSPLGTDAKSRGADVDSILWAPQQDPGEPRLARYIVDATVYVAAS